MSTCDAGHRHLYATAPVVFNSRMQDQPMFNMRQFAAAVVP